MSDHLPDNIDGWPVNPFEVLGIPRAAARPEIRRTYAALIRRFRPETHPREFQRIKESFEAVLAIVESRTPGEGPSVVEFRMQPGQHSESPAIRVGVEASTNPEPTDAQLHQLGQADLLWDEFSLHPDQSQLRRLSQLCEATRPAATVLLIGYWMSRLRPEFTVDESPSHWLIRGIFEHPLDSRFVDLLIDEFRRNPELTGDDFSGHVAAAIQNMELLSIYLFGRWSVIGERGLWSQLAAEIQKIHVTHPQFAFDYPAIWFRLMMLAFRFSVFYDGPAGKALLLTAQKEIASLSFSQLNHSADLDYMESLIVARANRHLAVDSDGLDDLLDSCLVIDRTELRRKAFVFVAEWVDEPYRGLDSLTQLTNERPEAFEMLRRQLDEHCVFDEPASPCNDELLAGVKELVQHVVINDYQYSRYAIVQFCHGECLTASDLLAQLDSLAETESLAELFSEQMRGDEAQILTCQLLGSFLKSCSPRHYSEAGTAIPQAKNNVMNSPS